VFLFLQLELQLFDLRKEKGHCYIRMVFFLKKKDIGNKINHIVELKIAHHSRSHL